MMRWSLALLAACTQGRAPSPPPAPGSATPPASDASAPIANVVDASAPAIAATELHPLAMAGPYKTIVEACTKAPPCGNTELDSKETPIKPPKVATCNAIANADNVDMMGQDANGNPAKLDHVAKIGEIRIGSQDCAVPKELRFDDAIYYAFVKRSDGWWRSAPLWHVDYNNKYCGASLLVRWNDKPDRTFIGIAANLGCLTCMKNGTEDDTIELMVRVEAGATSPIVFPPLPVGVRYSVKPMADADPDRECKAEKAAVELAESWPSPDELVLTGPATWHTPLESDGVLQIGLGGDGAPSNAGRYRFVR